MTNSIINTENLNEARKLIEKANKEDKRVIITGKSIDFNRIILENKRVNMLILSHENKKDKLKQRDSGLNHILCKLAKQNNIILAFDINELKKHQDKKTNALILARMLQNIKLIKKARNKFKLLNYNDKHQAFSFLLTLGLPTNMAKIVVETD